MDRMLPVCCFTSIVEKGVKPYYLGSMPHPAKTNGFHDDSIEAYVAVLYLWTAYSDNSPTLASKESWRLKPYHI